MNKSRRQVWLVSILIIILGILSLVLNLGFGLDLNFSWPLVVILLGGAFILLVDSFHSPGSWMDWFFLPGCILLALGIIFLFNVLTGDWNAWAYAWLLLLSGLGMGMLLLCRSRSWPEAASIAALATFILSLALFVLFGALTGGLFIQVMAPLLLVAFGISLRWLNWQTLLPESLRQRTQRSPAFVKSAASSGNGDLIEPLSERELEVLSLIAAGLTNAEIAARLTVALSTVKTHINNIYQKLGVKTRIQAIKQARDLGLTDS